MKKIWNVAKKQRGARKRKEEKDYLKYIPWEAAIFLLIVGIYFGFILTYSLYYIHGFVTIEETEQLTAIYLSYKEAVTGLRIDVPAVVHFSDTEDKEIPSACSPYVNWNRLDEIQPGTAMHLRLHPHSHEILEMKINNEYILKFEDSQKYSWLETVLSLMITGFFYWIVIYIIIKIIRKEII